MHSPQDNLPDHPRHTGCARRRTHWSTLATTLLATTLATTLLATTATAGTTHFQIAAFDGTGSTSGAFNGVGGIALSQSSQNVYVLDLGHGTLDKFDSSGTPQPFSAPSLSGATSLSIGGFGGHPGIAVDNSGAASNGNIYVASESQSKVYGFAPSGATLPGFPKSLAGDICGVGVDPAGFLWVSDFNSAIKQYTSSGNPTGKALSKHPGGRGFCHLVFDTSGNLYAMEYQGPVRKYNPSGGSFVPDPLTPVIDLSDSTGSLATDPSDHVYVVHAERVKEYNAAGDLISTFGATGHFAGPNQGVAVDGPTGNIFVLDNPTSFGEVKIFGPAVTVADVTTEQADNLNPTSATVHGTVNPDGVQLTNCDFEYLTHAAFQANTPNDRFAGADTAPCDPDAASIPADSGDHQVSADLSGLTEGTTYHVRLVAANANGPSAGGEQAFDLPGPPQPITGQANNLTPTAATLRGSVDASSVQLTDCHFEYVTDAAFQSTAYTDLSSGGTVACNPSAGSISPDSSAHQVSAGIDGLTFGTTYHFRLVAANANGSVNGSDQTFSPPPPLPITTTGQANSLTPSSATVHGTVNPDGAQLTDCHFDYGTTTSYGQTAPCDLAAGSIPADSNDHQVSADLTDLTPGATYHYRLVASNSSGTVPGADEDFVLAGPPVPITNPVGPVTDTTAWIGGTVDPNSLPTTYYLEYSTDPGFSNPTSIPASQNADAGSGVDPVFVSRRLTGLAPNTTYHFRLVAENSLDTVFGDARNFHTFASSSVAPCPNDNFRNGASADLPGCRAYEQVSPAKKKNANAVNIMLNSPNGNIPLAGNIAAADGNRTVFNAYENLPDSTSYGLEYLATRGPSGWSSKNLIPPQSTATGTTCAFRPSIMIYTPDLGRGVLGSGVDSDPNGADTTYCGANDPPLAPGEPQGVGNLFLRDNDADTYQLISPNPISGSPDNSGLQGAADDLSHVVFDSNAKLTPDAQAGPNLYDWSDGALKLASIVNGNPASASQTSENGQTWRNSVSADGSRILFKNSNKLYDRLNAATTVQVDAAAAGAPGPGGGSVFQWASADGSKVYFTAPVSSGLTDDTASGSGTNLYVYDVDASHLTNLTPAPDARVLGVAGLSDDASHLYFVAQGDLAAGAAAGRPNLFLLRNGTIGFVATLADTDSCNWGAEDENESGPVSLNEHLLGWCARLNETGTFFAFSSKLPLTGYPNAGHMETYLYDAAAGELSCASCSPGSASPTTEVRFPGPKYQSGALGSNALTYVRFAQRFVTSDGKVFVETTEQLLPEDTNDKADVYLYDSGQLDLISAGASNFDSRILDASRSGDDVFFTSFERLVPQDTDGAADVYDARVGGGFPALPTPPTPCNGDACQGGQSTPPADDQPGSPQGSGNVAPPDCSAEEKALAKAEKALKRAETKKEKKKAKRKLKQARKKLAACESVPSVPAANAILGGAK